MIFFIFLFLLLFFRLFFFLFFQIFLDNIYINFCIYTTAEVSKIGNL